MVGRAAMEAMLRPYGLGTTQWCVLFHLAHDGPIMQRNLVKTLRLYLDGSLARSLGFQPIVRTVHQAVQEKWM